jgi:adenylate cyclase
MLGEVKNINTKSTGTTRSIGLVLVVDDEKQNRALLRDPLEARGYEVEEAVNGMQALEIIAARPPDVILLDLMMPKMDGFEVCRRIRANAKTTHIPILMITALSERGDRLTGIQAGANDFLNKPIDLQDAILRVGNAVYAKHLYDQLQAEQEKSERLLLNILPKAIAERMKKGESNIADSHTDVTVLRADLFGFTSLSAYIDPKQIVYLLNEVFSAFDVLVEERKLEKIKTVGDAYMVTGGISGLRQDHPEAIAELAISLEKEIDRLNDDYGTSIRLRIGISTGPVIAGVIGRKKFAYDVWGEAVNVAWRLEATAEAGRIQISESTYERLKDKYQFEKKHNANAKGQSEPPSYWLGSRIGSAAMIGTEEKVAA